LSVRTNLQSSARRGTRSKEQRAGTSRAGEGGGDSAASRPRERVVQGVKHTALRGGGNYLVKAPPAPAKEIRCVSWKAAC